MRLFSKNILSDALVFLAQLVSVLRERTLWKIVLRAWVLFP